MNLKAVMGNSYKRSKEEAVVQAPVEMTPPGLPLPNGFQSGDGTDV